MTESDIAISSNSSHRRLFGAFYLGPLQEALLALLPAALLVHKIVARRLRDARINVFRSIAE